MKWRTIGSSSTTSTTGREMPEEGRAGRSSGNFFGLTACPAVFYCAGNRLAGEGETAGAEWDKEMKRLDDRTAKRRARAKEQDEEMQRAIREAEERRERDKPPPE